MTAHPPVLSRLLLQACCGASQAELVEGDLYEEFILLCAARGSRAGKRWYRRQVVFSLPSLLALRMRSGELTQITLAFFAAAIPLLFLDRLWCFVYSQIPMKDGLQRDAGFLAANVFAVSIGCALSFAVARTPRLLLASGMAAWLGTLFGIWASAGEAPPIYAGAAMAAAPVCCLVYILKRRTT